MSALAANTLPRTRSGRFGQGLVKAAKHIYSGGLLAVDSTGYILPAADTAGHVVIGFARQEVDNSAGASGDLSVDFSREEVEMNNSSGSPVTNAYIGKTIYVEDDNTVSISPGTNAVEAGICRGVDPDSSKVWVQITCADIRIPTAYTMTSTNGTAAAASASLANLAAEAEKIGDDVRAIYAALVTAGIMS